MSTKKEGIISRYIGTASDTKPTSVPVGTTYLEYDEGVQMITPDSGSTWYPKEAQLVDFLFRPGAAALASGMVLAGTRSYNPSVASTGGTASGTTCWSPDITYDPYQSGLIDGLSASGVICGQLTLGYIAAATTGNAKVTARIRNSGGTYTTFLGLTDAISASTTVGYKTYDIPYLKTTGNFNSVPFDMGIGVQSDASANSIELRLMESSYIIGQFVAGTS